MLNRAVLILICVISLGWISYVGLDVFYKTDRLDPELVFSELDEDLLIINRTDEFPEISINFDYPEGIQALVQQFVLVPRNERIFVSKKQEAILIESPNYWSEASVITYLKRKNIDYQLKNKEITIGNYQVKFKYHFLLIASPEFKKANNHNFELPKWDKNATAVLLQNMYQSDEKVIEIYQREQGQIMYQTHYKSKQKGNKVDDFRLFAAHLPGSLKNYHFFEKEYAIEHQILNSNSPILNWMDRGFVQFDYDGHIIYMTDIKIGEDPLNTFNTQFSKDTTVFQENAAIKNILLTTSFPTQLKKGFYFSRVGDKAVFSEDLNTNKKIVADYELGHTLLLNPTKSATIFGQLPDKVSERVVTDKDSYAVSTYNNQSVKYILEGISATQQPIEQEANADENQTLVVPVEGKLIDAIGKGNQQYFLTSSNNFYTVNNGKIVWQSKIEGKIKGRIKIVDYEGTGKVYLLLNTEKAIYLFTEFGENVMNSIAIPKHNFLNEVNFYRWKNVSYLVYSDTPNQLRHLALGSKKSKIIPHQLGADIQKVEVFVDNGRVVGLAYNDQASQTINLSNSKNLKKRGGLPTSFISMKNDGVLAFVGYENGRLTAADYAFGRNPIDSYPEVSKLKVITIDDENYIAFVSYQVLHVYTHDFKKIASFNLPINGIQDYDLCKVDGNLVAGFIDGLENKAFIVDINNQVISKEVEAKEAIFLSYSKQRLNILTVGNVYAVQYYDVLNKKE